MVVKEIAVVMLPTRWAAFSLRAYEGRWAGTEEKCHVETALALMLGDVQNGCPLVRIHSQCMTGEAFHSLRCDCHDQLHLALERIAAEGRGVLIYEQKEGRGIGLLEKLRAYELQDRGLDTIEANLQLGHPIDARDYLLPVAILGRLGIRALRLMTNNPEKIAAICSAGIEVVERLSADVPSTCHSAGYMAVKRNKLGHFSGEQSAAQRALMQAALATSLGEHGMTLD